MKKVLIFCLVLLGTLLTSCAANKNIDFTVISRDMSTTNYVKDTFVIIEDFDTFKSSFPEDQVEEFTDINDDTFSKHVLVYFEYISHRSFKPWKFILNNVYKENQTLFFEITTPLTGTTDFVTQTLTYLVKVSREALKNVMNYQLTFGTYEEVQ